MGTPQLAIRKCMTLVGAVGQAGCLVWFGVAKTPSKAALANCFNQVCYVLHHSGFDANLIEVGGVDTVRVCERYCAMPPLHSTTRVFA